MEIFQKAFSRERNKLYQSGGGQINKWADTGETEFPEYALYYSSALKYYEAGDLNKALGTVNRAIELSGIYDWKQYAFKANILEELEMYQEAKNAYEKAIEINPEDIKVYALYSQIGDCYMYLGNNEKGLEFYCYAIELKKQHPNSPDDKDMEGFENGFFLGKQFLHLYLVRANAHYILRQLSEAENDCFRAIEIDPEYSISYLFLFYIYNISGQAEKAMEYLKKAFDLGDPDAQKIVDDHSLGYYEGNNHTDEVITELKECLDATFEQEDLSEGKKHSLNLINKGVNDVIPYLCLAFIYEIEENWKECEDLAKSGLKFDEECTVLLKSAGVAICNQGADRIAEGLQYLEKGALAGDELCEENFKIWKIAQNYG